MKTIRKLNKDDFEDILEISKSIWEGHDYVPEVFVEWIENPLSHVFGIEIDGKVVSIANLRIIDQGKTGWMEGLRVHVDYRGKGLANEITDYLVEQAKKLDLDRLRYTTASRNVESLSIAQRVGLVQLFRLGIFWNSDISEIDIEDDTEKVKLIDATSLHSLIDRVPIKENIIIQDWKAVDATLAGLHSLEEKNRFWISINDIVNLSIGGIRKEASGLYWSFTIYVKSWSDLKSHLNFHIQEAKKRDFDSIVCTYPIEFQERLQSYDWFNEQERNTEVIMLEKKL
ncbi:MAG: GNAT family N-acetyltransferase [Candidatus Lokiarchaeota archaeon]|nr:GNAT family N-acetyltransferase [Candidatus Lokiarchaeota archaeon]